MVAGPRAALAVTGVDLGDGNWLADDVAGDVAVQLRSTGRPVAARRRGDRIDFAAPEFGVARGQAAVVYDGSRLLGGGTIVATHAADAASIA